MYLALWQWNLRMFVLLSGKNNASFDCINKYSTDEQILDIGAIIFCLWTCKDTFLTLKLKFYVKNYVRIFFTLGTQFLEVVFFILFFKQVNML
jgi:hypothetical protein